MIICRPEPSLTYEELAKHAQRFLGHPVVVAGHGGRDEPHGLPSMSALADGFLGFPFKMDLQAGMSSSHAFRQPRTSSKHSTVALPAGNKST